MTTPLDYFPPPPGRRFSATGAASLVLGVVTLLIYFFMLSSRSAPGSPSPPDWVPLVMLGFVLGCPLLGVVLGTASLRTPNRRRGLAIAGLALNGLLLLLPMAGVMMYLLRRGP